MSGAIRGLHNLASRVIDGVDFVADNEDSFFLKSFLCVGRSEFQSSLIKVLL